MKIDTRWTAAGSAMAMAIAIASTGCSVSASTEKAPATLSSADVEKAVVGQLDEPKPVSCPDPLVAKVDNSVDCTLKLSDVDSIQVKVTVTKVDPANNGNLDFKLSSLFTAAQLQTQVRKWVVQQNPDAGEVQCPEGLEGRVGASTTCTVQTADGQQASIKTTVEKAGAADMTINFQSV